MADKEATVYVVDVGQSMGRKNHGRDESDLDWAMKYVWDCIATTVGSGRKTWSAGVVAFRTDGTDNEQAGEEETYDHISVLKPMGQIMMQDVRDLSRKIKPSNTDKGDALSALVVAIQMIITFCKKLKYTRKIVLVTNGTALMEDDGTMSPIVSKLKEDNIELVILGADFDDAEYGVKEADKPKEKARNEETFHSLAEQCNAAIGTLEQAVAELGEPRVRPVRPTPSYKGQMSLGDANQYETALTIDVERYPKVRTNRPPTASSFALKSDLAPGTSQAQSSTTLANGSHENAGDGELSSVRFARTYQVKDESAPGGKRDVDRDDLAKGYNYGNTAVPVSGSDEILTKLETKASLEIVGFIPRENYDRYMSMSETNMIVGQRTNDKAIMALSSLIHALHELDNYAIGRLVTKDMRPPSLILLAPFIEPDFECLIDVDLPFAEDFRSYKFPPLDRITTVSGKILREHRNLPSDDLMSAMDALVDDMDLSKYRQDEDGSTVEYAPIDETYSPVLHRLNQAIRFRAVHPTDEVPPPYPIMTKFMHPPQDVLNKASQSLENVKTAADIKKVPPKTLSRKRYRGDRKQEQPLSGLDVTALLSKRVCTNEGKISPDNAIPEFKQALDVVDDIDKIKDLVDQLAKIIEDWITESFADSNYGRVVEASRVMRETCVEMEEPGFYNDFVRSLKKKIYNDSLGGDRRELWRMFRGSKIGLISKKLSPKSQVDEDEAHEFLYSGVS